MVEGLGGGGLGWEVGGGGLGGLSVEGWRCAGCDVFDHTEAK